MEYTIVSYNADMFLVLLKAIKYLAPFYIQWKNASLFEMLGTFNFILDIWHVKMSK